MSISPALAVAETALILMRAPEAIATGILPFPPGKTKTSLDSDAAAPIPSSKVCPEESNISNSVTSAPKDATN